MNNYDLYQVQNWQKHFENAKSRTVDQCRYVCTPNKHDGDGYKRIILRKDGLEIFAAWCLLLQVLSKQPNPRHGLLTHDGTVFGKILTANDIYVKTLLPEKIFAKMLTFVTSEDVAWVRKLKICQETEENGGKQQVFTSAGILLTDTAQILQYTPDGYPADTARIPLRGRARVLEGRKEGSVVHHHRDGYRQAAQESGKEDLPGALPTAADIPASLRADTPTLDEGAAALYLAQQGVPLPLARAVVEDFFDKTSGTKGGWGKLGNAQLALRRHYRIVHQDARFDAARAAQDAPAPGEGGTPAPRAVFACTVCRKPERECACDKPGADATADQVREFRKRYRTMKL